MLRSFHLCHPRAQAIVGDVDEAAIRKSLEEANGNVNACINSMLDA